MLKIAAIFLALTAASKPAEPPRAGIMITAEGRSILAADGPALRAGTSITLITIDNPQQVSWAVTADQLMDSKIMAKHILAGPYYAVTQAPGSGALPSLAVALIGRYEVERQGSAVILRGGKNTSPIRVRSCASSEGLHLTLWSGEPLKSTRLWHSYYYLGYDVVPSCQPADYSNDGGSIAPAGGAKDSQMERRR